MATQVVKNLLANGRPKRLGFDPWVSKIPCNRKWCPTAAFLPGKLDGQRSLLGYSPWGCKESDTIDQISTHGYIAILANEIKKILYKKLDRKGIPFTY